MYEAVLPVMQGQPAHLFQQSYSQMPEQGVAQQLSSGKTLSLLSAAHPELNLHKDSSLLSRKKKARMTDLTETPGRQARELERATGGSGKLMHPLPDRTPSWIKTLDHWEASQKKKKARATAQQPESSWLGAVFGDSSEKAPSKSWW